MSSAERPADPRSARGPLERRASLSAWARSSTRSRVFFEQLASVEFVPLLLAIACHLLKTVCTSRAWRNTIAAAYPEEPVPWRTIYGAYIAAVGVNAVVPVRGGDAVKLYLSHRAVQGATYTTLAATLLVLSIFDSTMAIAALRAGR